MVRALRADESVVRPPAKIVAEPPDNTHAWNMLTAWMCGLVCTAPFTIADTVECYRMIKNMMPGTLVEVYTTDGTRVFIRVDDRRWVLDVA